ncbi:MAG: hypothetical protein JW791_03595 [Nanoarchaeota archaeon]|nr:hypothetical protein [Nanoarchaeota archaeon]
MLKKEEKLLKEIKSWDDTVSVEKGDYLTFFKRIGDKKSVTKSVNIKPDFVVNELNNGVSYVFVIETAFDAFKILSKFLFFKKLGVPLDFKKLYFFVEENEELLISEEHGLINTENKMTSEDLWDNILSLVKDYEEKLEKEIILKIIGLN